MEELDQQQLLENLQQNLRCWMLMHEKLKAVSSGPVFFCVPPLCRVVLLVRQTDVRNNDSFARLCGACCVLRAVC